MARSIRSVRSALVIAAALLAGSADPAVSQEPAPDSVRSELDRLRQRIDSLEAVLRRLESEGRPDAEAGDALAELRAAAAAAAAEGHTGAEASDTTTDGQAFVGRQRSLQALNPEISVNADLFGHVNTDDPDEQNFIPREFEISLQSSLDPFSRAKVFFGAHGEGPETIPFGDHGHGHEGEEEGEEHADEEDGHGHGGGGLALEEGYVEWIGLPGGVSLKLGKFFQRFGTLNRWHTHALPFQSRSLPHIAFIGEEALTQTGASLSTVLPFGGASGTYDATLEVTRASNEALFGESGRPTVLGHVNGFWQLGRATDLDLGASWMHGSHLDHEGHRTGRDLYGVEGALTWRPPEQSRTRGLVIRGGIMLLDGLVHEEHEGEEEEEHDEAADAFGFWTLAEARLGEQWYVGARFDRTENPVDPDQTAWIAGPTLTWWQSEFVRLRLEYDLLGRSFEEQNEGRLWLQVTFAMGPHKHESY